MGLQKECKVSHQVLLIQDDYTNFNNSGQPTLYQLTNKNVNKNNNNNNNIHFMSFITKWARTRVVNMGVSLLINNIQYITASRTKLIS